MSTQLITIIVYAILIVGVLILEHYKILPDNSLNTIITLILGHAAGTNTLIPMSTNTGTDEKERVSRSAVAPDPIVSLPDITHLPTVSMQAVQPTKPIVVTTMDMAERG